MRDQNKRVFRAKTASRELLIEGWLNDQPWYGIQSGFWSAFIGVWALARYSLVFLLIGLGVSTIIGALVKPSPFSKPKPFVDSSLE